MLNTLRSEEVQNTLYIFIMSDSAFIKSHIIADALSITKLPDYEYLKYCTTLS